MAIAPIPSFSVRWTEPSGRIGRTEYSVGVDVSTPTANRPLTGHIDVTTAESIGPLPSGDRVGTTHVVRTPEDLALAAGLWKAVQSSHVRQWVPSSDDSVARLGRNEMELVIGRARGESEIYRTSVGRDAPAPIRDVIAAAASVARIVQPPAAPSGAQQG